MRIASAEALARLLAERLAETGEPGRAVTVAQLVEGVLPYPLVRERLGLAGKAEYDVALLRLLSDRVLLQLDPALHEAATRELEQPEPDLRPIEKLSESLLRMRDPATSRGPADAGAAEVEDAGPAAEEPPSAPRVEPASGSDAGPEPPPAPETPGSREPPPSRDAPALREAPATPEASAGRREPRTEPPPRPGEPPREEPTATPPLTDPPRAVACWSCTEALPMREGVRFCPRCGVDQQAARCTSCGDRLEPGWSFCPRCGRGLSGP